MSKRFFTNEGENTLLKKFAGVFASNPDIERFDALVGYLRASGYFALRPHLEKVPFIRIIVGIDVDDQLARHHRKGLLMLGDADKTLAFVRAKLAEDVQGAPYRRDIEEGIRQFVADVASNPEKRELYRERWKRVCHMKFQLVSPFFDLSFGLLRNGGQLGFIVSNAFAKREFGQPLVEDFFPTVDLQKVVDCSGLMFPGHGTPTCIVFGANRKPDEQKPIRVAALPPGGGDLRTPPEDSSVWHTLAAQHNNPEFINEKVVVSDRKRSEMSKWPWTFDVGAAPTKVAINANCNNSLRDFLFADVGFMFVVGRNEIFMLPPDVPRRLNLDCDLFKRLNVGDEIRNFELRGTNILLFPYDPIGLKLLKFIPASSEARYFALFAHELSERPTFSGTFGSDGREPYQFHQLPIERAKNPKSISLAQIATHIHAVFDQDACAFNEKAPLLKLQPSASDNDHHLLSALLNSSAALFWLKQICFSKRESEEGRSEE